MDNLTLQKVKPYYEQIYQGLKELIFKGEYQPGDRINEVKIAKEYNVSRSPVREAVRALEKEGLLVVNKKSQLEVYKPSLTDVEDIYQCRSSLESLAVKLTTENASNESIQKIGNLLEKTRETLKDSSKSSQEIILLNSQFHDYIVLFSKNERLQKLISDLRSLTHFYRTINFEGENRKETIFAEHENIFYYIKSRETKKASEAMVQHIMNDLDNLKSILQHKD